MIQKIFLLVELELMWNFETIIYKRWIINENISWINNIIINICTSNIFKDIRKLGANKVKNRDNEGSYSV
jgi:arginine repressor